MINPLLKNKLAYFIFVLLKKQKTKIKDDSSAISSLAPKILKGNEELDKVKHYLIALKKAIDSPRVNNIAITGTYGSGKSTIINTFKDQNRNYYYLNISLASFNLGKNPTTTDLETKLEISILQQIFYHVEPYVIPDSRFKRIVNITQKKVWSVALIFIIWTLSCLLLFKFDYINKINPRTWHYEKPFDWIAFFSNLFFFVGVGFLSKEVVRLLANSKINKVNIKGELELGDRIDKSVFNQHLDEILYYFERTKFNVVFFEDIDRFEDTEIFTKLRELNILLNNSNLIGREIKFIYAIKDDKFKDKNDRVKFFEYIIPIISFINPSNAGEQLSKLIEEAQLQNVLSKDFTEDIITFIDDIDMRLLINIFHEYCIYKDSLSNGLNQDELFAIVVYKNLFPGDFSLLAKRDGNLYNFLSKKHDYIDLLTEALKNQLSEIDLALDQSKKEAIEDLDELKAIYLGQLIIQFPNVKSVKLEEEFVNIDELYNQENFNIFINSTEVEYQYFQHSYDNSYNAVDGGYIQISEIEDALKTNTTYSIREKNIIKKRREEQDKARLERVEIETKINNIQALSLKEIFLSLDIDGYLDEQTSNLLVRNLLLNGYINENYNDYISLFHDVNLTLEDFLFEKNIRSGISSSFEYKLNKIENLTKKIRIEYYGREAILNFDLLDYLATHIEDNKEKYNSIIKTLSNQSENSIQFINRYVLRGQNLKIFIQKLSIEWENYWNYIENGTSTEAITHLHLGLLINFADLHIIERQNEHSNLKGFIELTDNFFQIFKSLEISKVKKVLKTLNIKFQNLNINKEFDDYIDFVYENNLYELNKHNINNLIRHLDKKIKPITLSKKNYSTIQKTTLGRLKLYIEENLQLYIEEVMLQTPGNDGESEENIIYLLNHPNVTEPIKKKIIAQQKIKIKKIDKITSYIIQTSLIELNKVKTDWNNVYQYYNGQESKENREINSTLLQFLNTPENYSILSKTKLNFEGTSRDKMTEFTLKIIKNENLELEAYSKLIQSTSSTWDSLNFEKLSKDKVVLLLNGRFLNATDTIFNKLKTYFPNLHIRLLELHNVEFKNLLKNINFDDDDKLLILKSSEISLRNKTMLIIELSEDIITGNKQISTEVCNTLDDHSDHIFGYNALLSMCSSNGNLNKKLQLVLNHSRTLSNDQMKTLIQNFDSEYRRLFIIKNKPKFPNIDLNRKLFEELKKRDLIHRYEIMEKNSTQLKVIAKY